MKKVSGIFLFLFYLLSVAKAQYLTPQTICRLPDTINESSGVEFSSRSILFTHNDSGDKPQIYKINTLGMLLQTIKLLNVTATDFEDMTRDDLGNMYIGDFGNNANIRTNLKIYKIPPPETLTQDSIEPEIISFSYPDQFQYPPDSSMLNFDCESMFYFHDSLYLFSKNRGTSTYCRMYSLPAIAGNYVATLVDSFNTHHWITSADINTDASAMILLSENRIFLFSGFKGNHFFKGQAREFEIPFTQKEAVVFINRNEIFLTDERENPVDGYLYYLNLKAFLPDSIPQGPGFYVYPQPAIESITLSANLSFPGIYSVEIITIAGQLIYNQNLEFTAAKSEQKISLKNVTSGLYFIRIQGSQTKTTYLKIIVE